MLDSTRPRPRLLKSCAEDCLLFEHLFTLSVVQWCTGARTSSAPRSNSINSLYTLENQ